MCEERVIVAASVVRPVADAPICVAGSAADCGNDGLDDCNPEQAAKDDSVTSVATEIEKETS